MSGAAGAGARLSASGRWQGVAAGWTLWVWALAAAHPVVFVGAGALMGLGQRWARPALGWRWVWASGLGWLGAVAAWAVVGGAVAGGAGVLAAAGVMALVAWAAADRRAALGWGAAVGAGWALAWGLGAADGGAWAGGLDGVWTRGFELRSVGVALASGVPVAVGAGWLARGASRGRGARWASWATGAVGVGVVVWTGALVGEVMMPRSMDPPAPRVAVEQIEAGAVVPDAEGEALDGVEATRWAFSVGDEAGFTGYVFAPTAGEARALVVFLPGSGWGSARGFARRKLAPVAREAGVVVATLDRIGVEPDAPSGGGGSAVFHAFDDKGSRVACARALIEAVVARRGPFEAVGVIGYSEGADVAARVARAQPGVDAVVLLGGGGYAALDEVRVGLRELLATGSRALDAVVGRVVDLYLRRQARRIARAPTTERRLLGFTYRRWLSYAATAPVDDLLAADARALAIHGSADSNVPVEAARYIERRFAEAGQGGFELRVRAGLDHSFRDAEGGDHLPGVLTEAVGWIVGRSGGE